MICEIKKNHLPGEYLAISNIKRVYDGDSIRIEFCLENGLQTEILWYSIDKEYEKYICYDRCDAAVATLIQAAMRYGYKVICSDYPISEKLYYNLQYHVIPQLYLAGTKRTSDIKILAPVTKECFHGELVATGMSRGVDSFASMYEYCNNFELDDYRVNTFTYFNVGAHHGTDVIMGRGSESREELFRNQLDGTKEFCKKYNYPLITVESNIAWILAFSGMFTVQKFDQSHTLRNLGVVILLQKGISKYYYSSTYNLNEFKVDLKKDMAYYEKWLIPHLATGSVEFYQANQNWRRIDKIQKLLDFEPCYDYLQVCLIQTGNCGQCLKCRRTLMELDAFGDDALEKFKNSFDIETYKRDFRKKWFGDIMELKEADDSEAHYFEETFLCAIENHPELLGNLIKEKREGIQEVQIKKKTILKKYPSKAAESVGTAKKDDKYKYLGEWSPWIALEGNGGEPIFVYKKFVEYI